MGTHAHGSANIKPTTTPSQKFQRAISTSAEEMLEEIKSFRIYA